MDSRYRRVAIGAASALVAVLGASALWPSTPSPRSTATAESPRAPRLPGTLSVPALGPRAEPRPPAAQSVDDNGPLPSSLTGTEVDGWLGVDDNGRLVVTPGARFFFDYFLSATGEESDERIRARIVVEIEKRLPPDGAQQAIALLDRYLAYRDRVRALDESGAPSDLNARLAALHDIRGDVFGDTDAAALFGEEEQMQAVDIQRRKVLADQSLTPQEREQKLDALEQQLPSAVRQARAEALAPVVLMRDEEQLRQAGASAEEIRTLRELRFGADAADRLEALDRERAEWNVRIESYQAARQAIENDLSRSADARRHAIEALLAERFSPAEQLRVQALQSLAAGAPP